MKLGRKVIVWKRKMKVGFGIKEWDIYTSTTLSILEIRKM
jgi:hypothetical protein